MQFLPGIGVVPAQPAQPLPKPLRVSDPSLVLGFTLAGQTDTLASEIGWFSRLHTDCVQAQYEEELGIIQSLRALTNTPRNPLESAFFYVGTPLNLLAAVLCHLDIAGDRA